LIFSEYEFNGTMSRIIKTVNDALFIIFTPILNNLG